MHINKRHSRSKTADLHDDNTGSSQVDTHTARLGREQEHGY